MDEVIALGFCVSVEHAKYMADRFNKNGIPSMAVLGESSYEERSNAKNMLINGIENGFLNLPKGCYIHLENQSREYILRNIKSANLPE